MATRRLVPAIGWPIGDTVLGNNWRIATSSISYLTLPTPTLASGILRDTNITLARLCYVYKAYIMEHLYESLPAGTSPQRAYNYNAGSYLFLFDERNEPNRFNASVPGLPRTNRFSGMIFINLLPPGPDDEEEGMDWEELIQIYAIATVRSIEENDDTPTDELRIFRLVSRGAPDDVDWDPYPLYISPNANERDFSTTFEFNMWNLFSNGAPQRTNHTPIQTMFARAIGAGSSIALFLNAAYHYWATRQSTIRRIHGRLVDLPEIRFVFGGIHRAYLENQMAIVWLRGFIRILRSGVQREVDEAMFFLRTYVFSAETRQSVIDIIRRDYGLAISVTDLRVGGRRIRNGYQPGINPQPALPPPAGRGSGGGGGGGGGGGTSSGATQSTNTSIRIIAPVRNTLIRRGLRSTNEDK